MEHKERRAPVLDPLSRASEVIFGLLMVLSFTGSLSVATAAREEVRTVMLAAIGCNLAWGLVDAVMYLIGTLIERARNLRLLREIREAADARTAQTIIAKNLPDRLVAALGPEGVQRLQLRLLNVSDLPDRPGLTGEDFIGAVGVFLLVVVATFPVVVPFVLISETALAMRVSNAVALLMLFGAGYYLGRYAGLVPWRVGLALAAVGAALVFVIIALGG